MDEQITITTMNSMTALQYMIMLNDMVGGFWSTGQKGTKASKSELRRWLEQSSVAINGKKIQNPQEMLTFPIQSLVLFPKSETKRITIF
jgi:tyrosyl-tRNA synthetase